MTASKEEVLAALPKLSRADLEAVAAVAAHLLGAGGALPVEATPLAITLFEALGGALGRSISPLNAPAKVIAQVNAKGPPLAAVLTQGFPGWDARKTTQLAFLRMLMGLLMDDLSNRGVTPSLGVVVTNLQRIPEVFDTSFPDYRASGLGPLILKRFQ